MADLGIRKDFVDGTYEIFITLFNEGETDGIKLYLLSDSTKTNVYKESKYKKYKAPLNLVSHVRVESMQGKQDVEEIKYQPSFVVPLKSFQNHGLVVDRPFLDKMKRGIIEFHGVFYTIDEVLPRVYIEDVFLFYHFICVEDKSISSVEVVS